MKVVWAPYRFHVMGRRLASYERLVHEGRPSPASISQDVEGSLLREAQREAGRGQVGRYEPYMVR